MEELEKMVQGVETLVHEIKRRESKIKQLENPVWVQERIELLQAEVGKLRRGFFDAMKEWGTPRSETHEVRKAHTRKTRVVPPKTFRGEGELKRAVLSFISKRKHTTMSDLLNNVLESKERVEPTLNELLNEGLVERSEVQGVRGPPSRGYVVVGAAPRRRLPESVKTKMNRAKERAPEIAKRLLPQLKKKFGSTPFSATELRKQAGGGSYLYREVVKLLVNSGEISIRTLNKPGAPKLVEIK